MEGAYEALNATSPNMTKSCWLCYGVYPPFYEGVALNVSHLVNVTSPMVAAGIYQKTGCPYNQSQGQELALGRQHPATQLSALPSYMFLINQRYTCFLPIIIGEPVVQGRPLVCTLRFSNETTKSVYRSN